MGCIILYDHLHPNGVFRRGPDVDIKSCITTVKVKYLNIDLHNNNCDNSVGIILGG